MRKLIVFALLVVMILCVAVLCGTTVPLVPEWQMVGAREIRTSLQEDIVTVRENKVASIMVEFSHDEYFYDEDIMVKISSNDPNADIYYTIDSSTPTKASTQYTQPIGMSADEIEKCVVLKAIAIAKIDGEGYSEVLTHSYFLGRNIKERFTTDYIFSLSTDDDNLYGYETGILVPGKIYDDYMSKEYEEVLQGARHPANYNGRGREWERPVCVEVLNRRGERVLVQNAGIRVNGGASRTSEQKSLRLIARKEYEPTEGKFKYPFFEGFTAAVVYKKPIEAYDTIVLRNDGNDWDRGRLRNSLGSYISREAGFDVVTPYVATAVFLNGEYYGYATIDVRINEQFLEDLYDAPERTFDIADVRPIGTKAEDETFVGEMEELLKSLQDGDVYEFERNFDVDNLLLYYAIEIYLSNYDWPQNNIKIWRYTGRKGANAAKELDGRWRFVLYDLDHTMYMTKNASPDFKTLHRIIEYDNVDYTNFGHVYSMIFKELMTEPKYVEKFANNICDLAYEHFSIYNVEKVTKKINESSWKELEIANMYYNIPPEELIKDRARATAFIEQRAGYILEEVRNLFEYTDMYQIVTDGSCKINTLNGTEGTYFIESHVSITPVSDKREVFDYWVVNGEKRTEEELLVSVKDIGSNGGGVVNVKAVYQEKISPLVFDDTYDDGKMFGFTMSNPTDKVQNTQNLYLSDNGNDLKKWRFPNLNIRPKATWNFVGKNATAYDALLKIELNFNPRKGEIIFLSNADGEVLDYILMGYIDN